MPPNSIFFLFFFRFFFVFFLLDLESRRVHKLEEKLWCENGQCCGQKEGSKQQLRAFPRGTSRKSNAKATKNIDI
jgi:hypothetical protein